MFLARTWPSLNAPGKVGSARRETLPRDGTPLTERIVENECFVQAEGNKLIRINFSSAGLVKLVLYLHIHHLREDFIIYEL